MERMKIELSEFIMLPELLRAIVGELAFLRAMTEPEDANAVAIEMLSVEELYRRAEDRFVQLTDENGMIATNECDLEKEIRLFLTPYCYATDTTAWQQNIHYSLSLHDQE